MACFAFHVVVVQNLDRDGAGYRWFAGEGAPIKRLITFLFFVGAAALVIKAFGLIVQFGALQRCSLTAPSADGHAPDDADSLLAQLDQCPASLQHGALARRLRAALLHVKQLGSSDGLTNRLAQLAEADRHAMPNSYSGVRAVTLAIPFVGLLGALTGDAAIA
jgi:hypothetical protein